MLRSLVFEGAAIIEGQGERDAEGSRVAIDVVTPNAPLEAKNQTIHSPTRNTGTEELDQGKSMTLPEVAARLRVLARPQLPRVQ
jgi:hypothetical protein